MKFLKFLGELLLEIILSLIMFLIGYALFALLGIEVDPDLALLIGSLLFIAPFIIIAFIVNYIKSGRP